MIDSRLIGLFPVLLCLMPEVLAQQNGGSFECRPNPWIYGELFTITFRLDQTKFPSMCTLGTNGLVLFQSSPDNVTFTSNCSNPKDITKPGSCSFTPGTLGCGCTAKNDSGYYIEYNFIAGPDYDGRWRADIGCPVASTGIRALSFSGDCYRPPDPCFNKTCSGHGSCSRPHGKCTCDKKYGDNCEHPIPQNVGHYNCSINKTESEHSLIITLSIDNSKHPSLCNGRSCGLLELQSSTDNVTFTTNCRVPLSATPKNCSFTPGKLDCNYIRIDDNSSFVIEYRVNLNDTFPYPKRGQVLLVCQGIQPDQVLRVTDYCTKVLLGLTNKATGVTSFASMTVIICIAAMLFLQ